MPVVRAGVPVDEGRPGTETEPVAAVIQTSRREKREKKSAKEVGANECILCIFSVKSCFNQSCVVILHLDGRTWRCWASSVLFLVM